MIVTIDKNGKINQTYNYNILSRKRCKNMNENKFDRIDDKPFPNRTYKGILLPIL